MKDRGTVVVACSMVAWIASLGGVAHADSAERAEHPWSVFAGYHSHAFSEPGVQLGGEYALVGTEHFASLLQATVLTYGFGARETGYALQARWGQRYTASFGLTIDSYFGLGVQYTVWETTTFQFKGGRAEAQQSTRTGAALVPHFALGLGYDFARLSAVPLHVYARAGLTLLYPDLNDVFNLSAFAELGVRWTLRL